MRSCKKELQYIPTMMLRFITFFTLFISTVTSSNAQAPVQISNYATLNQLYSAQLQNGSTDYIQTRIQQERTKANAEIQENVRLFIEELINNPTATEGAEETPLETQKRLIVALENRLANVQADFTQLQTEQALSYSATGMVLPVGSGALTTTDSYPDLLTKLLIAEERLLVLDQQLKVQTGKKSLLEQSQIASQFSGLITVGIWLLCILILIVIERIIHKILVSRIRSKNKRYYITKVVTTSFYVSIILLILITIIIVNPKVFTSFAIIGAGIAVALQDIIKDVFGALIISQRQIFSLGDRVTVGTHTGEVIDVGILRFTLLEVGDFNKDENKVFEHTGKTVSMPNAKILSEPVTNHSSTSDLTKQELRIIITFESNRDTARKILQTILAEETEQFSADELKQRHKKARKFFISIEPIDSMIYESIAGSGYQFTLRFVAPIGLSRSVITKISTRIMEQFDAAKNVHLAYETYRIIANK